MYSTLYLLNDNVHSFDEVVLVLQRYLGYPSTQSASIADIVHRKGLCQVTSGELSKLEVLKEMLMKEGYRVKIEEDYEQ